MKCIDGCNKDVKPGEKHVSYFRTGHGKLRYAHKECWDQVLEKYPDAKVVKKSRAIGKKARKEQALKEAAKKAKAAEAEAALNKTTPAGDQA